MLLLVAPQMLFSLSASVVLTSSQRFPWTTLTAGELIIFSGASVAINRRAISGHSFRLKR